MREQSVRNAAAASAVLSAGPPPPPPPPPQPPQERGIIDCILGDENDVDDNSEIYAIDDVVSDSDSDIEQDLDKWRLQKSASADQTEVEKIPSGAEVAF